jgi:hypothetical protein
MQYTLWDAFKVMQEQKVDDPTHSKQAICIGRLTADLIQSDSIPLSVLKTINLIQLSKLQSLYLATMLQYLLIKPQKDKTESQFYKPFLNLAGMKDMETLKDGLVLFLSSELSATSSKMSPAQRSLMKERMKKIKSILQNS